MDNDSNAASIEETREAIDSTLRSKGGQYSGYSCKFVSWDDVSRGTVGSNLSCWGANITDTYLKAKDGIPLFTVRPDNWNEKLGVVQASDVALLIGNCETDNPTLRNVTLLDFLKSPYSNGAKYTSLDSAVSLHDSSADDKVSIRFQTVFIPVNKTDNNRATFQFATEAYNYNTRDDKDPRNLVLLATTQGLAVQADGAGKKRLLHHAKSSGVVNEYWLEAEQSDHKVGGEQKETETERKEALERGKAVADTLGIKAMGKRFNTLMTLQIPLKKQVNGTFGSPSASIYQPSYARRSISMLTKRRSMNKSSSRRTGHRISVKSNAARVSRGDIYGRYPGLSVKTPERNPDEHVTVTVVFYNTVAGGVPNEEDIVGAIDDMEKLLLACSESGRLKDAAFNFMKEKLSVEDVFDIQQKRITQPPSVVTNEPENQTTGLKSGEDNELEVIISAIGKTNTAEEVTAARLMTLGLMEKRNVSEERVGIIKKEFEALTSLLTNPSNASNQADTQMKRILLMVRGVFAE